MNCSLPDPATSLYSFETLPLHPQPEHLEFFTSYLMRLAEANGIKSVDGLSALCFPNQNRRVVRDMTDYPPLSFDRLTVVGNCTRETLLATTFFHVAAKFGRSTLPQPLSRFLSGCLSECLRYCPICLTEQQTVYYPLSWRFLPLSCCIHHGCRMRESCGQCRMPIPLFASPFKIAFCPLCGWNLRKDHFERASENEQKESFTRLQDLEVLLTPHQWEIDGRPIIKRVGQRLASARKKRHWTAVSVTKPIGVTLSVIEGIERGNSMRRGATLQSYIKYADHLGLSLQEAFGFVLDEHSYSLATLPPQPPCPSCKQSYSVTRDGYNRSGTQRYQCQGCFCNFIV